MRGEGDVTRLQEFRPELVVVSGASKVDESKTWHLWQLNDEYLRTADGFPIQLHYHPIDKTRIKKEARGDGRPVLLLHGASAGSDTFLVPRHTEERSFVDYLLSQNYEPWLLDWRASKEVTEAIVEIGSGDDPREVFARLNFNDAAKHDLRCAIEVIETMRPDKPIDVVAHCMGATTLAEALLSSSPGDRSHLSGRLSHVVLSTIGLFYQMNLHGRLKAEAHLLKRMQDEANEPQHFLDPRIDPEKTKAVREEDSWARPLPRNDWPAFIETLYDVWRVPYDQARMDNEKIPEAERHVFEMFNRLSFMFGEPYQEGNLAPEIHHCLQALTIDFLGDEHMTSIPADSMISVGDEPLGEVAYDFHVEQHDRLLLYRCQRRAGVEDVLFADGRLVGRVIAVDEDDPSENGPLLPKLFGAMSLDLFRHGAENLRAGMATELGERAGGDVIPLVGGDFEHTFAGFESLDRLTLIGGGLNRLWHRDCIDRMADWLDRSPTMRQKCRKAIFLGYGHQDLFWGRHAADDVFPTIIEGLGPRPPDDGTPNEGNAVINAKQLA